MNSPRDLRRRIKSISGTAQITKAMQMVAASKMRKAQQAALAARPFAQLLYRIQRSADDAASTEFTHPLLEVRAGAAPRGHPDRRRQGPVRRAQHQRLPARGAVRSGVRRCSSPPGARRRSSSRARSGSSPPSSPTATRRRSRKRRAIAAFARDLFLEGRGRRRSQIVATHFVNTLTQEPVCDRVPAGRRDPEPAARRASTDADVAARRRRGDAVRAGRRSRSSGTCSAHYLNIYIYYMLLNAKASEQSARMVSMKNATDNAEESDRGPDARIQQAAPGQHHEGTAGDRRRHRQLTARIA